MLIPSMRFDLSERSIPQKSAALPAHSETELLEADILVSDPIYAPKSYLEYYGDAHNVNDMLLAGKIIQKLYPNDYSAFEQVMRGRKYYFGNLCVMKKQLFDDYCSWLFSVFFEMEELIDVSNYDEYHKRVFGFLSEELLLVYITARKLRVKEGHIGITSEKAETIEFKLAMGQLVKQGAFTEARKLFYDYLKIRPDVQLELSDITNEIPDIELILFILEKEQEQGIDGLMTLALFSLAGIPPFAGFFSKFNAADAAAHALRHAYQ